MSYLLIKNARVIFEDDILKRDILVKDSYIADTSFSGVIPDDCEIYDANYNYLSPGFIDIHIHGGGGYDFMDCTEQAFKSISDIHLKNGSTTIIPTAVSSDFESTLKMIESYKKYEYECPNFYGIHLEGPYISAEQKGAHKEKYLHSPTDEEIKRLLDVGKGVIKRITAAPELDNMENFAKKMRENGVHLSIGHSNATSDIALEAFKNGFSHITHLYSATPSIRKINQMVVAGVVEAAYLSDETTVEMICDGKHAAVDAVKLALKIKGIDKVCMVSDALRPAGTDVKESYLGERTPENRVIIEDGVAKLPDRSSFAGSIATGGILLKKGVEHYGISLVDTVKLLTSSPASIVGMNDRGQIKDGLLADFVIFDESLNICNVIKKGRVV